MQKAILLRVSRVERHANLYCSRRDTVDFSAERGHECLAPKLSRTLLSNGSTMPPAA